MSFDANLFFFLNNLAGQSHIFDLLIIFFARYLGYFLTGIFLILAYRARNRRSVFLAPLVAALIARLSITELIRLFIHRPRPFATYQAHQLLSESTWSFPSGHAAFFFALAAWFWFYDKKWGSVFFFAAVLMTAARMIAGVHYPSDIAAGMAIGVAVACAVHYFFTKKSQI